jgi:hypothetical protein
LLDAFKQEPRHRRPVHMLLVALGSVALLVKPAEIMKAPVAGYLD